MKRSRDTAGDEIYRHVVMPDMDDVGPFLARISERAHSRWGQENPGAVVEDVRRLVERRAPGSAARADVSALEAVFRDETYLPYREQEALVDTIGSMADLARDAARLFPDGVPLLPAGAPAQWTLSKLQAACLLAHCFFCTFPLRTSLRRSCALRGYQQFSLAWALAHAPQKLLFFLHYFRRALAVGADALARAELQIVRAVGVPDAQPQRDAPLCALAVSDGDSILDHAENMVLVDFANRDVGGGVLRGGALQEEILFLSYPELAVAVLVAQRLGATEALVLHGAERYSTCAGYGASARWAGDFVDTTPVRGNMVCFFC